MGEVGGVGVGWFVRWGDGVVGELGCRGFMWILLFSRGL